jgi:signal transduction histidine kinase/PAS domain-containing protein
MNLPVVTSASGTTLTVAPSVILYVLPALIAAELALYSWQWRHSSVALPFSLLMAAVVFWSVCHAVSVASSTLPATLFWAQVQYGGIVMVAPAWLLFALAYRGKWSQVSWVLRGGLLLPGILSYAAVLTNEWHHLWWPTVALDTTRPFGSLSITRGLLFWLHYGYSYGCIVLGYVLIVRRMLTASPIQRYQTRLVAIGALFPIVGNLAHVLGVRITAVDDPTPFLFVISGLVIFYAALRYQFPDAVPLAAHELFASMPDGLVVLDQNGLVTALNDIVPGLLALAAEGRDWIGRLFQRVVIGSPLEIDLRALLIPPAPAATCSIVYQHEHGVRAVELRLRPLYTHDRYAGSLLVVRDRTERAQMEQALDQRLNELMMISRLARAANAAPATDDLVRAITRELIRLAPGERIVIGLLHPNDAALHLIVDEQRAAAPTLAGQVISGNDFTLVQNVLRAGQPHVIRISEPLLAGTAAQAILHQHGLRTVLVVPLVSQAEPLGAMFVGQADDQAITPDEVRLFETVGELVTEAIVRTRLYDQSQEAMRVKSTFLATITHELRSPLTSIIGFTDLLDRGFYGELAEGIHEPLAYIRRNSQTLLRLINDILDFSKMEAGQFTIELSPVDLVSVIEDVVGAMQPQIQQRGLSLKVEIAAEMPLVHAHRERLEQVLTNLIANAIKFTDQGTISVRTTYDDERVHFSVTDTGIGIAQEQQQAVFEEFGQIESEQQARYPGTGLGLPISRRLMELMGGTLTLESSLGVGSTFSGDVRIVSKNLGQKEQGAESR